MDARIEGMHGPAKAVDRECCRDVGGAGEPLGAGDGQRADRSRGLRAVDEREPFFWSERNRRQPRGRERVASAPHCRIVTHRGLALADEHERKVRERGEVAARAHRPAAWHPRVNAMVQEVEQPLERRSPDS